MENFSITLYNSNEIIEVESFYDSLNGSHKKDLQFKFNMDSIFVGKISGKIIGIMSVLTCKTEYLDLRRFVIDECRNNGYADKMLDYLIEKAKTNSIHEIKGTILSSNQKGIDYFVNKNFMVVPFGKISGVSMHLLTLILPASPRYSMYEEKYLKSQSPI